MLLMEIQARSSKPRERVYKLADGEGLFLFVQPNGSKLWRILQWANRARLPGPDEYLNQ